MAKFLKTPLHLKPVYSFDSLFSPESSGNTVEKSSPDINQLLIAKSLKKNLQPEIIFTEVYGHVFMSSGDFKSQSIPKSIKLFKKSPA